MMYVHIGIGKAGSTTLQSFLRLNRIALEKRGYCFPDIEGVNSNGNATPAALSLTDDTPQWVYRLRPENQNSSSMFEQFWTELIASKSESNGTIIASSEEFEMVSPDVFFERSSFDNEPKKIILFLRRQDRVIESLYVQLVRFGYVTESLTSFVENILNQKNPASQTYAYHDFISRWCKVFGKNNVTPIIYHRKHDDFIFHAFMDSLGIKINEDFRFPVSENVTNTNSLALLYLRFFNWARIETLLEPRNVVKHRELVGSVSSRLRLGEKRYLLPMSLRVKILEAYREQNRDVAREFFPAGNPDLFDMENLTNLSEY